MHFKQIAAVVTLLLASEVMSADAAPGPSMCSNDPNVFNGVICNDPNERDGQTTRNCCRIANGKFCDLHNSCYGLGDGQQPLCVSFNSCCKNAGGRRGTFQDCNHY